MTFDLFENNEKRSRLFGQIFGEKFDQNLNCKTFEPKRQRNKREELV